MNFETSPHHQETEEELQKREEALRKHANKVLRVVEQLDQVRKYRQRKQQEGEDTSTKEIKKPND